MTTVRAKILVLGQMGAPAALLFLGACHRVVDDPRNIPKLGQWADVGTIDSVTMDGLNIPESRLPDNARQVIARIRQTQQRCGEPMMSEQASFEKLMGERIGGECRFDSYDPLGSRVSATGHCKGKETAGLDTEVTVKVDGAVEEERVKINFQSIVRVTQKTGASNLIVMSGRRIFRRLGDCGAS